MPAAPIPADETERLASLNALDLLDSSAEAEFDELVKAAALVCDAPISLISLIDSDRQWFKANVGLEGTAETPRESAFCAHAILDTAPLEVSDASTDPRFADNPLVLGDPTFEGFNQLDAIIALGILNRVKTPGWRVSIASPRHVCGR